MSVTAISKGAAFTKVFQALHLPPLPASSEVPLQLIAQALRRAAHILAPCPRHELERSVRQSLGAFADNLDVLNANVSEVLDSLFAFGDIIEMRPQADDPWSLSPLVIRPAPPAFVARKSGVMILLGVAGDEITPLSSEMNMRVECRGVLRTIMSDGTENLHLLLTDLGLLELSERAWLRLPPAETAAGFRAAWNQRLTESAGTSAIEGLKILDGRSNPSFYNGRWVAPTHGHNGLYVARRTQRYGAPLWCLVDLVEGVAAHFLDLTAGSGHERPCDVAWRVQMALDAGSGTPQRVRLRASGQQTRLDFYSPIPSWAERKLAVDGKPIAPERCLFSYEIPAESGSEIVAFLQSHLWMTPESHPNEGPTP
jgi:hypothetical protein